MRRVRSGEGRSRRRHVRNRHRWAPQHTTCSPSRGHAATAGATCATDGKSPLACGSLVACSWLARGSLMARSRTPLLGSLSLGRSLLGSGLALSHPNMEPFYLWASSSDEASCPGCWRYMIFRTHECTHTHVSKRWCSTHTHRVSRSLALVLNEYRKSYYSTLLKLIMTSLGLVCRLSLTITRARGSASLRRCRSTHGIQGGAHIQRADASG